MHAFFLILMIFILFYINSVYNKVEVVRLNKLEKKNLKNKSSNH